MKQYITARSFSELRDAQTAGELVEYQDGIDWVSPSEINSTWKWAFDGPGGLSAYRIVRDVPDKPTLPASVLIL